MRLHRVLDRLLPPGAGRAALADLDRELDERGAAGPLAAAWYGWEALKLVVHFLFARIAEVLRALVSPPPAPTMDQIARDLRFASRRLLRNSGFAMAAILTLALGVGANVAVFSVVDAVLLRPLPYRAPDQLVVLGESPLASPRMNVANPGNVRAWRERSTMLSGVAHLVASEQAELVEREGRTEEIVVRGVSPDFFEVLGLDAALGRTFVADAGETGGYEVLLSHAFWRRSYGADPEVIGRTIGLSGASTGEIVGVLPEEFIPWGDRADLWVPFTAAEYDQTNSGRFLNVIGRLAPGVTADQARAELDAIASTLRAEHPERNTGWGVMMVPMGEHVSGPASSTLWILVASVALLLLIACANVSNLLLARASSRRKEMAVRTSLGAGRSVLVGQLLAESAVLSVLGGAMGLLVAYGATTLVATHLPDAFSLPRVQEVAVDGRALVFALAVVLVTAVLFGILPALQTSSADPGEALASEARGPSRRAGRTRSALVVVEVAVSVILLVGAGLVARSLGALLSEDIGIEPDGVLTARVSLVTPNYVEGAARVAFAEELARRVQALPGVEAAGLVPFLPLDGLGSRTGYYAGDRPAPALDERPGADVRTVSGDYFGAMGIEILTGRAFDDRDRADSERVVIVSRTLAEAAWPGQDPIGRPLVLEWGEEVPSTVVGVVEDVRQREVETAPYATVWYPYAQLPDFAALSLATKSNLPPARLVASIEEQLHAVDPSLALAEVRPMEEIVARAVARPRLTAMLMGVFALVAAALAGVGLYGVLAFTVSQRVREIGVRVALGAAPRAVLTRVVREGMGLVLLGIAVGVVAALQGTRFLRTILYGVEPTDAVSVVAACIFLSLVAFGACIVPAWRATRVDPVVALRND